MSSEVISLREFSRRVGVSDTTVRNNKEALKPAITKLTNGRPAIKWEDGYKIWITLPVGEKQQTGSTFDNGNVNSQKINVDSDDDEGVSSAGLNRAGVARNAKAILDAKLKELEYKEKSGKLVDKQLVYNKLFDAGRNLRLAFQSLPDRVIDNILANTNRNEARHYLLTEINKILGNLEDSVETVLNDFD